MKSTVKISGLTAVAGVPKELSSTSGRLVLNKKYKIIGYYKVPAQKDSKNKETFKAWTGVLIERLDTGSQLVVGVNTLLGQSICFVGKDADGASAKGYKVFTVNTNAFTSPNDFAHQTDGSDNGTVFEVTSLEELPVNKVFLGSTEITAENLAMYTETKNKQFYCLDVIEETKESV